MTADVGGALFALRRDDGLAAEQRQIGAVGAVGFDVVGHGQAEFQAHLIVVIAVGGRGVDKAGAGVIGDVVARQHGDVVVPFAVAFGDGAEGVGHVDAGQGIGGHVAQAGKGGDFGGGHDAFGQLVGKHDNLTHGGRGVFGGCINAVGPIADGRIERHCAVLRDGPGRRGPDHHDSAI